MNCACNRYKTCTECRNAYKETVKREHQILDAIALLESRIKVLNGFCGTHDETERARVTSLAYKRVITLMQDGVINNEN